MSCVPSLMDSSPPAETGQEEAVLLGEESVKPSETVLSTGNDSENTLVDEVTDREGQQEEEDDDDLLDKDEDLMEQLLPTRDEEHFGEEDHEQEEDEHREDISDDDEDEKDELSKDKNENDQEMAPDSADEEDDEKTDDEDDKNGKQAVSDISDTEDFLGRDDDKGDVEDMEAKAGEDEEDTHHQRKFPDSDLSEVSKKGSGSEDELAGKSETEDKPKVGAVQTSDTADQTIDSKAQVMMIDGEKPKRKSKNYDYATKLNYLFRDARFFLVKSNTAENVTIAKNKGVWSTPFTNETKLNQAYHESRNVLLLFSVKESGKFCGLARIAAPSSRDGPRVPWVLAHGLSAKALGGVFKIDWVCKTELSFQKVQHLYNPWNEGKPVKIGRDGQQIEPKVAEELCRLFSVDKSVDMTPILRRSKETARTLRAKEPVKKTVGPLAGRTGPMSGRTGPLGGRLGGRPDHRPSRGMGGGNRGGFGGGNRDGGRRGRDRGGRGGGRGGGMGGGGGPRDRGRKRPRVDDGRGRGRAKMPRFEERRRPPVYRERSPLEYPLYAPRAPTYTDYLRVMTATRGPPQRSEYMYPTDPYLPTPPPRYYDGATSLLFRRRSRSRSYDRSVEEFIRRNSRRSRDRSMDRHHRISRSRTRSRSRDRGGESTMRRYRR